MTLTQFASEVRLYLVNRWVAVFPSHRFRLFCYRRLMRAQIGPGSSILMDCWFDCADGLIIGENSTINQRCRLDTRGSIRIGNSVSISAQVTILTADHDPDSPQGEARLAPVIIEDHVFIGTGALILKGVRLGKGAIVGAGSVVTHDIPSGEIWAGNPARLIRKRKAQPYPAEQPYRRFLQ